MASHHGLINRISSKKLRDRDRKPNPGSSWISVSFILLIAIAAIVYGQFGFDMPLRRDEAVLVYSGQRMLSGIPPYESIFQPKTPLAPLLAGFGAWVGSLITVPSLLAIRATFLVTSCFTVAGLYRLMLELFGSQWVGWLAAAIFLGFIGFGTKATAGTRAKTLLVLFQILTLYWIARKAWFKAALSGTLAFLTWQPGITFLLTCFIFAFFSGEDRSQRGRNLLRALLGTLLPLLTISAYLVANTLASSKVSCLPALSLVFLEHPQTSIIDRLINPLDSILRASISSTVPIMLGLLMMFLLAAWRVRMASSIKEFIRTDPFSALIITFPCPVLWSLLDFQAFPDFYVFLVYVCAGLSWMLSNAFHNIEEKAGSRTTRFAMVLTIIALMLTAARTYQYTRSEIEYSLDDQRQWAKEIEMNYLTADEDTLVTFGRPEALVLLERVSPTRHIVLNGGEHQLLFENSSSLAGWLARDVGDLPHAVIVGPIGPLEFGNQVRSFLRTSHKKVVIGEWQVFIEK